MGVAMNWGISVELGRYLFSLLAFWITKGVIVYLGVEIF